MNRSRFIVGFLAVMVLALATMCASEKPPSGGPKDKTPPKLLAIEPVFGVTNFSEKTIKVHFDEYLQLKNLREQMVISPPMKENPEVMLRGKSVFIKIKDTLRDATTYTLFFGDAIADLNESNAYTAFRYVFSTGDYIDSLSVKGKVVDAKTGDPVEDAWVVLYEQGSDTMFMTSTPYYIASTDENGIFRLDQLKDTVYMCYAIEDINSNYYFDLPGERIAFMDSLIFPGYESSRPDSLPDSIPFTTVNTVPEILMKLYAEPDTVLKLLSVNLIDNFVLDFVFNNPAEDLRIVSVDSLPVPEYISRKGVFGDTLRWWIKDTTARVMNLAVINDTTVLDTVRINLIDEDLKAKKRGSFLTHNLLPGSRLAPGGKFKIRAVNPLDRINQATVILKSSQDSVNVEFLLCDSMNLAACLDYPFMTDSSYLITLYDSAFFDIYGNTNDSVVYKFTAANEEAFGNLEFELSLPEEQGNYVLYLNDSKGKALASRRVNKSGVVKFNKLNPGKYGMSILMDLDNNGRWSSGRITHHLQPEQVLKYDKEIEIRANWVVQESWEIQ